MQTTTPHNQRLFCHVLACCLLALTAGCSLHSPHTEQTASGVRFILHAPAARTVAVVGDFNKWVRRHDLLAGPDKRGFWTGTIPLQAGRYEYLFLVDDTTWVLDPAAIPADDGLGGQNSVLIVSD
jgi:1,4-alpha-glucan branching enzyme